MLLAEDINETFTEGGCWTLGHLGIVVVDPVLMSFADMADVVTSVNTCSQMRDK
jgi:hypothetical protein